MGRPVGEEGQESEGCQNEGREAREGAATGREKHYVTLHKPSHFEQIVDLGIDYLLEL